MTSGLVLQPDDTHSIRTRPLLCAIVVLIGGILAYALIPQQDWMEVGAMQASGAVMCLSLMFGFLIALFRNPVALFRAEHMLMLGLVYWLWLDAVQASFPIFVERSGLQRMVIGTTLFACFFWIGAALAGPLWRHSRSKPNSSITEIGPVFLVWAAIICALLSLSYPVLTCQFTPSCLYDTITEPRFGSWRLDHSWGPLKRFRYAGYMALPLTVAHFLLARRWSWQGVVAVVLTLAVVLVEVNSGRRGFGTTIGAGLMVYVLMRPQLRVRHLLALLLGGIALLMVLQAMLAWRDHGVGKSLLEGREVEVRRGGVIAVDKNIHHGSRAMWLVPESHPHTGLRGLTATLLQPVPRSIWKSKPYMRGFHYSYITERRGDVSWTATYSIIGDLYIIGGWLALAIGGLLYGVGAHCTSRLLGGDLSFKRRILFAAITMILFVSFRAFHELSVSGFGVVALWGLLKLRDYFSIRKPPPQMPKPQSSSRSVLGVAP